ncbi:MAG: thioesterase family protein [Bacteroidaceae bacterium]|nr:thioesterase family protein [Bacteroidaceae bacterium]
MLKEGLTYKSTTTVSNENSALTMGSGNLPVFATPAMVALMENATMLAVADALPEGFTTVGSEMNVRHIKPSPVGAQITAVALLTAVEGRKLTFDVSAYDGEEQIGKGVHVRFMVDIERFMNKINR